MTRLIVADAGPLIGLARIGLFSLLSELSESVLIPSQVLSELQVHADRPGSRALLSAIQDGKLVHMALEPTAELDELKLRLDPGEAEAILLAEQLSATLLLDEKEGRIEAESRGLTVVGTGAVLVAAKKRGLIEQVGTALDQLLAVGYRISPAVRATIRELAGES